MENINELKDKLKKTRPNEWEQIPDLDLYMDQIISYMPRQHIGLESGEALTSAMINNYIKVNLLPRAKGKKYTREHIAYLTAICLLKQVLPVDQVGQLLKAIEPEASVENFYNEYKDLLDEEFSNVSEKIALDGNSQENSYGNEDKEELGRLAMKLAISSYANKLACQEIVKAIENISDVNEK